MASQPNPERDTAIRLAKDVMTDKETDFRLGMGAIFLLVAAALIADTITLIPIAGDIVGPIYWIMVTIFLYIKGFGILNTGRLATTLVSLAAELIPGVQELPFLFVGTILIIILSRIEDKTGIKSMGKFGDKAGAAPGHSAPLNQGGVRRPLPAPDSKTTSTPLNSEGTRAPTQPPKSDWRYDEESGKFMNDGIKPPTAQPDWAYDKKNTTDYAAELKEKYEVAKRLGHSSEEAARMATESADRQAAKSSSANRNGY